jgi:glycosyltransferase involved in cell wall biosynthesis
VAPSFELNNLEYIKWQESTEIFDLQQIDIGLMPLTNDEWSSGKCGFKLIQYMALEIPSVASPVGVNTQLIKHGINGFLCNNHQEWYNALEILLNNPEARLKIGAAGRSKIETNYSLNENQSIFLGLFE